MTPQSSQPYDVTVIGLGYIGLPTATFFAASGLRVYGYDINPSLVDSVQRGEAPFVEPGFESLLASAVGAGNLKTGTIIEPAKSYIVAVPTPLQPDQKPDVSFVFTAAATLAPLLKGGDLVVLESTCPPGLTEDITNHILNSRPDLTLTPNQLNSLYVAHAPERVLPGKTMSEMTTNDRIVGGVTTESAERAKRLYKNFCTGEVLITDSRTAEMAKLAENSFRDVNIAFANELSLICDDLNIDVWELISLANRHPRVNILQPGPGVGGHCIAVDPWFIVDAAADSARLIKTSREVNDSKPQRVLDKISKKVSAVQSNSDKLDICLLGITFKPDIDDIRESPALYIAETVARTYTEANISIVEPNLESLPEPFSEFPNVTQTTLYKGLTGADIAVVLVDHSLFKQELHLLAQHKCVIDTRGILNNE